MAALHMRGHIVPGVSLPKEDSIVLHIEEYVSNVVHGNAQHTTVPYRSLTSHQKSILRDGIQYGKAPWEIRRDINTATPDDIISNRVAQNARYYQRMEDWPESTHRLNVVDDVHSVLNMSQNSPFVGEVITKLINSLIIFEQITKRRQ